MRNAQRSEPDIPLDSNPLRTAWSDADIQDDIAGGIEETESQRGIGWFMCKSIEMAVAKDRGKSKVMSTHLAFQTGKFRYLHHRRTSHRSTN